MTNTDSISLAQAVKWSTMYYVGSAILVIPTTLASAARQDAWICAGLTIALQLLLVPLWVAISKRVQGGTIGEFITSALGNWVGKISYLLWIVMFPFQIMIYTMRNLGDFITTIFMQETPIEAIHILYLLMVIVCIRMGVVVAGFAVDIFFPVVTLLFLLFVLLLIPQIHPTWIMPMLMDGVKPIIRGMMPFWSFPYMETFIVLHLVTHIRSEQPIRRLFIRGSLYSGFAMFLVTLLSVTVLNGHLTEHITYPSYFMARHISIGDFIERLEALIAAIWYITAFFRMALLMHVCSSGLAHITGLTARHVFVPLAIIALPMSLLAWPNVTYLKEYIPAWSVYAVLPGLLYPLLLLLLFVWRKRGTMALGYVKGNG
jgi:spore germination protein KB